MGQVDEEGESSQSARLPFDLQIACADGVFRYLANLISKSTGASVVNSVEMGEDTDAFLTNIFFGVGHSRLSQFFRSDGIYNFFGYANPQVDEMLAQLNQTGNLATRRRIGGRVLSLLQKDLR